ncbi:hypothetical protein Tdes44962_MAKER10092, partial [Teratosphaeria destructans]
MASKKGGWGSLLSGAVANLESRLDTILAEDGDAPASRPRATDAAPAPAPASASASASGTLAPKPADTLSEGGVA